MSGLDLGMVRDKEAVRRVIEKLLAGGYSDGPVGVEQAVNAIGQLQRRPRNVAEAALTVTCPYCGFTPGNPCRHRGEPKPTEPHPSRVRAALFGINVLDEA